MDSHVIYIGQEAALLVYGDPQDLEVFKNTLPSRIYWVLFLIDDLRKVEDSAKKIPTKDKIERQLAG